MPRGPRQLLGRDVAQRLEAALPGVVTASNDEWVEVAPARIADALLWLHDDPALDAAQLSNLCGVDRHDHFEVVYHLQSLDQNHQIVVKTRTPGHASGVAGVSVPSCFPVYSGALLQEREVYDLSGVMFTGHPDMATRRSPCARTSSRSRGTTPACRTSPSRPQGSRNDDLRD